MIDLKKAARRRQLCSISYEVTNDAAGARCRALGFTFVALVGVPDRMILVAKDGDSTVFTFRGTQVRLHTNWWEIEENCQLAPVDLGNGRKVRQGYWNRTVASTQTVSALIPDELNGHSLGGASASSACEVYPTIPVWSFGAPPSGNKEFWLPHKGRITRIVHDHDIAPDDVVGWEHPSDLMYWFKNESMQEVQDRDDFADLSIEDHDIDSGYSIVDRLAKKI